MNAVKPESGKAKDSEQEQMDDVLKRMLNTPHKEHKPKKKEEKKG